VRLIKQQVASGFLSVFGLIVLKALQLKTKFRPSTCPVDNHVDECMASASVQRFMADSLDWSNSDRLTFFSSMSYGILPTSGASIRRTWLEFGVKLGLCKNQFRKEVPGTAVKA
jgi:hypothetical protein